MPSTVVLHSNLALPNPATSGATSTVGEPSVANNADHWFVTGNWYAAASTDQGGAWHHRDPYSTLPADGAGFCCDQTAIAVPGKDLIVWVLQYSAEPATGENVLRIAIKKGKTLGDAVWHWWDLKPSAVNPAWKGEWFDYNHAAISNNYLYVGTNTFKGESFTRATIFRIPLADLADEGDLAFDYFTTTDSFSLRCTQGAANVMYFAAHRDRACLRVYAWPENAASPTSRDVPVSKWNGGSYSNPGPDNRNWLGRCDERITGAWAIGGTIGFMWTANSKGAARPRPYVRVVRIDVATMRVIDEPDIYHMAASYAYPDAAPNADGELGVTVFRGGGGFFPGHVVGAWDRSAKRWLMAVTKSGTHGPQDGKWGDYLTCRPHAPDGKTWLAVGYSLQGGPTRSDIEPRVVRFGISMAAPAVGVTA